MGLLAPAFLAGLLAIGIPIAIHLINRERKVVVHFPSLMFLNKIPYRSVRRQKLRHLLLLALRCLALLLLVAAFARPFLQRHKNAGSSLLGARERVILVDRSYSMGYADHWKRALDAARSAAKDLSGNDRATIVFFANDPVAATEPTGSQARVERAIAAAKLSSEGTRYEPAVKLAAQILSASNLPRKEVVLISDFQRVGWGRRDDVQLPVGTAMTVVDVGGAQTNDLAVTQVSTDRDHVGDRDRVTVTARVTNTGDAPRTVDATLDLGGRAVETKKLTVPPKGVAQARFAPNVVPATATRGTVRITHDSLAANDAFNFTLAPGEAVSVLIVQPSKPRANQSLYLSRALEIGDKPAFHIDIKSEDALRAQDLTSRSLVVLDEVAPPNGALGAKLREAILAGTGLLVVPGDLASGRWSPEWRPLMPATLGGVIDRTRDAGATVASVDYGHPVFELFSAPRSGDFSTAHLFRYRQLVAHGDSGVIARLDDGAPALVEKTVGGGKVLMWTSSLDEYWTDLPLQPVFLPFVHSLAKYAGRYGDARAWFQAGDVLDLSRHGELTAPFTVSGADAAESPLVLESPSGHRTPLTASGAEHLATLSEQGFYELRGVGTAAGSGRPIAVNVDPKESDLSRFDPKELVAAVTATSAIDQKTAGASMAPEDVERGQTIWWYLLVVALLLMVAETILSNRLSKAESAIPGV
jgi:Aerotolerance regulator N-terminal/von Willebrand factor type A domain